VQRAGAIDRRRVAAQRRAVDILDDHGDDRRRGFAVLDRCRDVDQHVDDDHDHLDDDDQHHDHDDHDDDAAAQADDDVVRAGGAHR
jgi:hypothetical protein